MNIQSRFGRWVTALVFLILTFASLPASGADAAKQEHATPETYSCDDAPSAPGTPMAGMDHDAMATPGAMAEFGQLYIDMMIPHHASIIALAQAALPCLEDERLREIAQTIIETQTAENDELRGYRERFYGSPEPVPMDEQMMMQLMPTMQVSMDEMMAQMDPATQVALICAASDADLTFIDLTIPHHQSAIAVSETALDQATHEEIRAFAERVIEDQQREIEELQTIRQELYGSATPTGSPGAVSHGGPVTDQVSFVHTLRAHGLTVEPVGPLQQPFLQPQSGTILRVSGGGLAAPAEIQVYEYVDEAAAEAEAAQIGPDGNPRTAIIEWTAPPHFFRTGRIIVLHVGTDQAVIDLLTEFLGPQFAGGR